MWSHIELIGVAHAAVGAGDLQRRSATIRITFVDEKETREKGMQRTINVRPTNREHGWSMGLL
jgi:hypothetical protein